MDGKKIRESTNEEIENTVKAFVRAAHRAHEAGLDGVELHGAHGYLIHQFLSSHTNQRSDQWGKDRTLFLREIVKGIRQSLPDSFILGVRLSPEDKWSFQGIDIDECRDLCMTLSDEGIDFIHLSPWDAFKKPEKYLDGEESLISFFRKKIPQHIPVMVAGLIKSGTDAARALQWGADMVAVGRMAIPYPNWPDMAANPEWHPAPPPYSRVQLQQADLGEKFIDYMKGWKNFVAEDSP